MIGENLKELENLLLNHSYDMSILKRNAPDKKKEAILDSLIISVVRSNLTLEELKECIEDVNNDEVIDISFFETGGNLFEDFVKEKWVTFAKTLFRQRSVGLGTPNAASGEGELMFLFLSKHITKPTKGDLEINNEIIELKGERDVRVMGEVRGKDFRTKTLAICRKYNLTPNQANRTNLEAVELEKVQHLTHWNRELNKLDLSKQKQFVGEWLKCLDNSEHSESVEHIFRDNEFNHSQLIKEIIKILYAVMVRTSNFTKFIILGNGHNVQILSQDIDDFNERVDSGQIISQTDYFRINQNYNIGWYITM
jgi:hypothetical protein